MADAPTNPELMRSLGRLVRGLSALFWGLPITLVVCFHTSRVEGLKNFGPLPPAVCTGLLLFGVWLLGDFQKQERVWRNALDLARLLGLVNFGLSPFLFWAYRVPGNEFFSQMVLLMVFSGVLFLASLNLVLKRLGAMLPDEALRQETRQFTAFNLNLLMLTLLLLILFVLLGRVQQLPHWLGIVAAVIDQASFWLVVLLVLLPLAMTMALIWKTKEVILENVFQR